MYCYTQCQLRHCTTSRKVAGSIPDDIIGIFHSRNNPSGRTMAVGLTHPVTEMSKGKGNAVPLQAWSGPEGSRKLRFPDFMTTAQDGGKVVNLTHRPPLPPGNAPGTHFCYRLNRPQGHSAIGRNLCQWKIPVTQAGSKPATFRFVAQHLHHCATAVPQQKWALGIFPEGRG